MTTIKTYDENHFLYNDDLKPRVFRAFCKNEILSLVPTGNAVGGIFNINIRNLEVDGNTLDDFASETDFKNEIQKLVFNKGGAGSNSGAITTSSAKNHVFIDASLVEDEGVIEDSSKPFSSIDNAIQAYNTLRPRENNTIAHDFIVVKFLSNGVYDWNWIPERNIVIDSEYFDVKINFANSPNLILNEDSQNDKEFNLILKGDFLKIKNYSENRIQHQGLYVSGNCHYIDSQRAGFSGFTKAFINAAQIQIKYDVIYGYGNVFCSMGMESYNKFIGDIQASGNLCINSQGNGDNEFDFNTATSTAKLMFLKASIPGVNCLIKFGDCCPTSFGNIVEGQTVDILCKPNAKIFGRLLGDITISGGYLEAFSTIARIGGDFTIRNMHIVAHDLLVSGYSDKTLTIVDSTIELKNGALYEIETDTDYTNHLIVFKGWNTIVHDFDSTPLIEKFVTAEPTNVIVKNCMKSSLNTNAVLNDSLPGDILTLISIINENTNTY